MLLENWLHHLCIYSNFLLQMIPGLNVYSSLETKACWQNWSKHIRRKFRFALAVPRLNFKWNIFYQEKICFREYMSTLNSNPKDIVIFFVDITLPVLHVYNIYLCQGWESIHVTPKNALLTRHFSGLHVSIPIPDINT